MSSTTTNTTSSSPKLSMPRSFTGINHLKLPCVSLSSTINFYTTLMPFTLLPHYNHYTPSHHLFAQMVQLSTPGGRHDDLIVEFRHLPEQVEAQRGWDPITWGVGTRADLEEWACWFDAHGVEHSKILKGIKGWVMGVADPDGRIVRLYVEEEEHEWTDHPDEDERWLGKIVADPAER